MSRKIPMTELRATYDNPATCCREWWVDGKLDGAISYFLLAAKQGPPVTRAFAWLVRERAIPWKNGRIDGDAMAIAPQYRPPMVAAIEPLKPRVITEEMVAEARERLGLVLRHGGSIPPTT